MSFLSSPGPLSTSSNKILKAKKETLIILKKSTKSSAKHCNSKIFWSYNIASYFAKYFFPQIYLKVFFQRKTYTLNAHTPTEMKQNLLH